MIPLIDVSLVLLIIFMVMTPFLVQQQVRVSLPQSVSSNEAPRSRPIVIAIQKNGEMSLKRVLPAVAVSSLENTLKAIFS